jgi:ribonuclease J
MNLSELKVIPLGGLGEIGMNCMVLEYQDEIIVVDCGLMFSDLAHFGVEFLIPDFTYLKDRKEKLKAFIITHGHEDHIGALPFALKLGLSAPIYASHFSSLLIRERLVEYGLEDRADLRIFRMGETIAFEKFQITTVSVNHSIVDSAALLIQTPVGQVVHTGDFKIDPTPFFGQMIDLQAFGRAGDQGVLMLLSDSTNVERHEHSMSEKVIYQKFEALFAAAQGLTIVSMFASNLGRMGQVFELAKKLDKKIALAGRSMEQNVRLGMEAKYFTGVQQQLISLDDLEKYPRNQVILLSTGSQGEHRSALIRIASGEHSQIQLQPGDLVLMSSKFIPGNEKAIGHMINSLFKQGADVLYEAVHDIHVSGHATRPELKQMLHLVRPQFFIPIHGEYRHLVHHAALAKETGVLPENVLIAVNGDIVSVSADSCSVTGHLEEPRVLVEGRDGQDISKLILRERRQMGEKGLVFALLVRSAESRKLISGPEMISKGLAHESREGWLMEEAKNLVKKIVSEDEHSHSKSGPEVDLQESIRIQLRRFFYRNIGKKPIVIPIILDL